MARRATPPPPPESRQFRDTAEIDLAIAKLQRRVNDIEKLGTNRVRSDDAQVGVVQRDIRNTIRDVFGQNSPEFRAHEYFEIDDGPQYVEPQAYQEQFEERIPGATTRVQGLIARLVEKREELAGPEMAPRLALENRTLHPAVAAAAKDLYRDGHYPQAVFEAGKALIALVKNKSGRANLEGVNLMRTVFSVNSPLLAFNRLADPSDRDEQEGMMHLYEGAAMAVRNPGGHRVGASERPDRALQYLELLSFLADRLDETRKGDASK